MKKITIITLIVAILTVSIFSFAGCIGGVEAKVKSFTAAEAFKEIWEHVHRTPVNDLDYDLNKNISPQSYVDGSDPAKLESCQCYFNNSMAGKEMAWIQFFITADADVEGSFRFRYNGSNGNYTLCGECPYSLSANEKTLISFNFSNNFVVERTLESGTNKLYIIFDTELREGTDAWLEWANTSYSFSEFEIGLNEAFIEE
ncbi:MAG TPA: hypothetical protein DCG79_03255 [Clostridiales bacterium]|nr:hypothetical protein [Clostridiales bacterium]